MFLISIRMLSSHTEHRHACLSAYKISNYTFFISWTGWIIIYYASDVIIMEQTSTIRSMLGDIQRTIEQKRRKRKWSRVSWFRVNAIEWTEAMEFNPFRFFFAEHSHFYDFFAYCLVLNTHQFSVIPEDDFGS